MLMTIEEAMKFLKLSKPTIYKLCVQGKLPAIKIGGSWRIKRDSLLEMIK